MTTKKNMVKLALMSALTAGIFGFTACSDDLNELDNNAANVTGSEMMNLEQYSYTVPVEIDAQGAWKAEVKFEDDNHHFCYALPSEGVGPQRIQLCVLDNWTDVRNSGELVITTADDPTNSKIIKLTQKCNLDNATRGSDSDSNEVNNGPQICRGDIIFGVGYGINIATQCGPDALCRNPIIAIAKLQANEADGYGRFTSGTNASFRVNTYTGSSVDEIVKKMEASASLKGSFKGFKAEVGGSFNSTDQYSSEYMFSFGEVNVAMTQAYLEGLNDFNIREYMTDDAKKAIDGNGSTSEADFQNVIRTYGTHLVKKCKLGGQLRYATTVKREKVANEHDMKVWANANYKNTFVEADVKVSNSDKESHKMTDEVGSVQTSAVGGSLATALAISSTKDTQKNVENWMNSLSKQENLVVVDLGNTEDTELVGIWELVDEKYPERAKALKAFIEGGKAESNVVTTTNIPDMGEAVSVNTTFNTAPYFYGQAEFDGFYTKVKTAKVGERTVAYICKEYIPQLTVEEPVIVIYPVEQEKPNFEHGFFVGTDDLAPHYVSWEGANLTLTRIPGAAKGAIKTVYIKDKQIFCKELNGDIMEAYKVRASKVSSLYLSAKFCNMKSAYGPWCDGQYPLVKVANKIWTAVNYSGEIDTKKYWAHNESGTTFYFKNECKLANLFPRGWKVATSQDYRDMIKHVSENNTYPDPSKRLWMTERTDPNCRGRNADPWDENAGCPIYLNSVSLFNIKPTGKCWEVGSKKHVEKTSDTKAWFITSDDKYVEFHKDGSYSFFNAGNYSMPVRLVME